MRLLFLVSIGWCLIFTNAWAGHEADHRYNVRGYILDKNEKAISNQDVRVFDGNKMLAEGKTDSVGFYSLHLRLHNEDRGRKLRIRSGSNEAEISVSFDVADVSSQRVHDANFIDDEFIEGSLNRFQLPTWVYPIAGLLTLGFVAVKLEKRRKKKRREKLAGHTGQSSSAGHKKKKKKRKRR